MASVEGSLRRRLSDIGYKTLIAYLAAHADTGPIRQRENDSDFGGGVRLIAALAKVGLAWSSSTASVVRPLRGTRG